MCGPIVVDFVTLRDQQEILRAEAHWMAAELDGLQGNDEGERADVNEARRLVWALGRAAGPFLDGRFAALKRIALLQRDDRANGSPDVRLTIRHTLNGLNAVALPINGLIERLTEEGHQIFLATLLMAGMTKCLNAVDAIHDELSHVWRQEAGEEEGRDDFGVCDPATD